MLEDRPVDTTMFTRGLVEIPKPLPIQAPAALPTPIPIPQPAPLPRPALLPGTANIDQYYFPPPEIPSIVADETDRLTALGTPAIGQYLPPRRRRPDAEATRLALNPPLTAPSSVSSSQINLPNPNRFWSGTAAGRRVTMPSPETIWRGTPTTSQIALPTPADFWRR